MSCEKEWHQVILLRSVRTAFIFFHQIIQYISFLLRMEESLIRAFFKGEAVVLFCFILFCFVLFCSVLVWFLCEIIYNTLLQCSVWRCIGSCICITLSAYQTKINTSSRLIRIYTVNRPAIDFKLKPLIASVKKSKLKNERVQKLRDEKINMFKNDIGFITRLRTYSTKLTSLISESHN